MGNACMGIDTSSKTEVGVHELKGMIMSLVLAKANGEDRPDFCGAADSSSGPRVKNVRVWSGALVDSIMFEYADGTSERFGSVGGSERSSFMLEADEYVEVINHRAGDSLDAVQFVSNTGRTSRWYGNPNGGRLQESFVAESGNEIVGVERQEWGFCPRLVDFRQKTVQGSCAAAEVSLEEAMERQLNADIEEIEVRCEE